ncbi:MAG: diguanylate cyclase [Solirubrobacterales bacterium]|nr:diguanylate cyclase [Solirubrobacterales bacterium]
MAPRPGIVDRLSSFRTRLGLFFLLIVVVPMIAVAFIVFRLIADSEKGQAGARIAARQEAAISLYYGARDDGDQLAARIGRDPRLAAALREGDRAGVVKAAERLRRSVGAERIVLRNGRDVLADVGDGKASFPATRDLVADGRRVAELQVSARDAIDYARLVRQATGLEVVVRRGDQVLAATLDGSGKATVPEHQGSVQVGGEDFRASSFALPDFLGRDVGVTLMEPQAQTASDIRDGRILASAILAGFFLLALLSAVLVSRTLQRQIGEFLAAARRLGGGGFSAKVPTRGNDEFAQLGHEFNKMSGELETRLEELRQERHRLELSLRRIGETFASNLDRDALLEIVVRTSVDAVNADGGRAAARRTEAGELEPVARVGRDDAPAVAADAERQVLEAGRPAFATEDGASALAHPLRAGPAAGEAAQLVTGMVSVWRHGRPFSDTERELFHYLAGQAAVSVENVGLHETVERQAVTDELTGLSNRRRFDETISAEVERSRRFGQDVGLVLLDIDDFKRVNDTYGHQQGDLVLKEVARILKDTAREIDEPARYGGEELAVVLPGTDLEGAYNLAERVREGIEDLRLPILGENGDSALRVTASFGVAALPVSAEDLRTLVSAADEALYEAKRTGKNKTVRAG